MRAHLILVLALSLLEFTMVRADDTAASDAAKIQGRWKVIAGENNGKKIELDAKGIPVVITGDTIRVRDKEDQRTYLMTYQLDPARKAIRLTHTEGPFKGKSAQGIYQLDGDTLKLCYATEGNKVPTELSAKAGTGQLCFVMERAKK
jgi:uncharacterized protein (TIGR03067 family)